MIQQDLARKVFKELSGLGLSPPTTKNYCFKDSLKQCFIDSIGSSKITIGEKDNIAIEIKKEDFTLSLFTDFYFGCIRIREQMKCVNSLIEANTHVAWILTTAYYACYFMAVEIAKLHGRFIINFSKDEFVCIQSNSHNFVGSTVSQESNNYSFEVTVKRSKNYDDFLDVSFKKSGSKPHQVVWVNLSSIITSLTIDDNLVHHQNLLREICDPNKNRWKFPSTVRNEWNYTYADYYSDRGVRLGDKFMSIIKKCDSAMNWANNRSIQPNENNITASIAYLYHCLYQTIEKIDSRINQS
jgi:hypothetical protein